MRGWRWVLPVVIVLAAAANGWFSRGPVEPPAASSEVAYGPGTQGLPAAAIETLAAIEAGGPFAYDRDGAVFQNREGRLPQRPRGYYREYTVPTPGAPNRGARRIVSGGDPPVEYWYTDDHYGSFRRIEVPRR